MEAAPSLIPEALAAVTVPSFLNAVRRVAIFSMLVSGLGCSSRVTSSSPLRVFTLTAVISFLNTPPSVASAAFRWLLKANSSCSSREMVYLSATFSAVTPMW